MKHVQAGLPGLDIGQKRVAIGSVPAPGALLLEAWLEVAGDTHGHGGSRQRGVNPRGRLEGITAHRAVGVADQVAERWPGWGSRGPAHAHGG